MTADRRWSRKTALSGVLLTAGACLMLPFADLGRATNVPFFLVGAAVVALAYLWGLRASRVSPAHYWIPLLAARLVLLWSAPSADVHRYTWEGTIQLHGFVPYCSAPSAPEVAHLRTPAWERIEHKDVSAIYPPAAELGFAALAAISSSVVFFKAAFLLADLAICALLARRFGYRLALLYGWNPLVIYAVAGGGHYDSWFALAVVGGWLLWERRSRGRHAAVGAAVLVGTGVALKWLSLPMLGWVAWRLFREDNATKAVAALGAGLTPLAACWVLVNHGLGRCLPFPAAFAGIARSAELLPALVGPLLPPSYRAAHNELYLFMFLVICAVLIVRIRSYEEMTLATFLAAIIITPMFHAWYAAWLVPFAVRTRSRAVIAFSLSSFVYFWLHYRVGQPGGVWLQSNAERLLLWAPLIAGGAWDWLASVRVAGPTADPDQGSATK